MQSLPRLSGGWLKGVNSTGSTATYDIGCDGKTGSINQYVGRDALGFNLNYFLGDYKAIDAASNATFPAYKWGDGGLPDSAYRPLYNGNISSMANHLRMFDAQGHVPILYNFQYDQLNRLLSQNAYYNFDATTNSYRDNWDFNYTFHERMSYDANGNIQTTVRHALAATGPALMDSLFYKYYAGTNQLRQVIDHVPDNSYGANAGSIQDIDSQTDTSNYAYDSIGNLIRDKKEGITNVKWNVYGKITEINRTVTPRNNVVKLVYNYDAQGNRIGKVEYQSSGVRFYTWYARDAQGNLMSTYAAVDSFIAAAPNKLDTLVLSRTERQIYGSSRLGAYGYSASMDKGPNSIEFYTSGQYERGWRQYELTNHLGNVLTTISDRKIGVYSGGSLTIGDSVYAAVGYYEPFMTGATDYYPFGMVSRRISPGDAGLKDYRFGFNGQEMSNEIKGFGNSYTATYWEYDSRIGRRWNLDPVIKDGESPYASFHNNPIMYNDPFGDDPPKKPGRWTRFWRAISHDYYKTRAENYANEHNIDEENIVKFDNTWVVIDDKNSKDVRFSIFRQSNPKADTWFIDSDKHDDINLTQSDLLNTNVMGETVMDAPIPGAGISKVGGVVTMGGKSRLAILGVVKQTNKVLEAFQKYIRFGVTGHPDVLKKGFHLHFDEVVKSLELGLRPLDKGKIGFVQVGKLSVGTANDIKKSVDLFNQAMQSSKFRSELIVRLKTAQEYLQKTFKFTADSQLAIDKAHEMNYLIKAVEKF